MTDKFTTFRRLSVLVVAFAFISLLLFAIDTPHFAYAAQVTNRSITMSDSAPSIAGPGINNSSIGTGQNVTYDFSFVAATTGVIKGVVASFCDNTPFISDPSGCTAITGFTVAATPTLTVTSGLAGSGWTTSGTNDGVGAAQHILELTNSGSTTSVNAGSTVHFSVNGFTNPSTGNHPFYARILTYSNASTASAYTDAAAGSYVDYGGIALSTANVITINARVQETLTFCVSGSAPSANCGSVTSAAMTLGHGTNHGLDSTAVDTGTAYSQVSTNATSGVIIRMRNSNLCGGLSKVPYASQTTTSGCDIPPINNNAAGAPTAAAQLNNGTAGFGVNVSNGSIAASSGGSGVVTASSIYNNTSAPTDTSYVGMNITASASNAGVNSTYGDMVASSTTPISNINNTYTFGATASNLTPAGIYSASMSLIATGTY